MPFASGRTILMGSPTASDQKAVRRHCLTQRRVYLVPGVSGMQKGGSGSVLHIRRLFVRRSAGR